MTTKETSIVKRTIDLKRPPLLSPEQKSRLDALAAMPDDQIDYSEAPFLPDAEWIKTAGKLPSTKKQITLRVDAEVLEFFKETGARYQSRMNSVLRSYFEAQKAHAK